MVKNVFCNTFLTKKMSLADLNLLGNENVIQKTSKLKVKKTFFLTLKMQFTEGMIVNVQVYRCMTLSKMKAVKFSPSSREGLQIIKNVKKNTVLVIFLKTYEHPKMYIFMFFSLES